MSTGPIDLIVGCPECENRFRDEAKVCPVCRGEPIRVTIKPWERDHDAVLHDAHTIKAYASGFKDGLRLAKKLRERIPYPSFRQSNAIMHP